MAYLEGKDLFKAVANHTEFNTLKMLNRASVSPEYENLIQGIKDRLAYWLDDSLTAFSSYLGISLSGTKNMRVEFYEDVSASTAASMGTSDGGASLVLRFDLPKIAQVYDSTDASWEQIDALVAHEVIHGL
ncbi:hypothetical protein [Peribacillus sp. Hz7]|uniref:hypothetical protein n=1 Tax=Peribacillus sp. Hz7 TaxID=3344873 RepID=UPI0035CAE495